MPALMFVFGIAVRYYAGHYHTDKFFHCVQDNINCSDIIFCSNPSNETSCCFHDQFDCVTNNTLIHLLDQITLYCLTIAIVVFFSAWAHGAIFHYVGEKQMLEIRKRLFRSIIMQDIGWFDVVETAEITSKMTE